MNAYRLIVLFGLPIAALAAAPSESKAVLSSNVDFRGEVSLSAIPNINHTFTRIYVPGCGNPFGCFANLSDTIVSGDPFLANPALFIPVGGLSYVDLVGGGMADITTMYGIDANPPAQDLTLTGFDPVQTQISFSNETFTGVSQNYDGVSLGTVAIGGLAASFPNFDLSPFGAAMVNSPNSLVFAFKTTVPLSDFPFDGVPEPATFSLLGLALLLVGGNRNCRRDTSD